MPDLTPAEELRAAAATARSWAAADSSDPWTPSALAAFGSDLARWLEETDELHEQSLPGHANIVPPGCQWCADEDWPCADMRNALATARAINATAGGQP